MKTGNQTSGAQTIEQFLNRVKQAAEANTEPGTADGKSTHQSTKVDDGTEPVQTGEQAAFNEKMVKKEVPNVVDGKPELGAAKAAAGEGSMADAGTKNQIQLGTKKAPTGGDPSVETASLSSQYPDPGSSHPARADNKELDGHKYAADLATLPVKTLIERFEKSASLALAGLEKVAADANATSTTPATAPAAPQSKQAADARPAAPAGSAAATAEDEAVVLNRMKAAAADVIATAIEDADNVVSFLQGYKQASVKVAGGMPMGPDPAAMGGMGGEGGGGMPPELAGAGAGAPPAEGGEAAGGGGGDEAALMQIVEQVAQETGQPPEQVLQALMAEMEGGGGGGGAPAGGEAPPMGGGEEAAPPQAKAAADRHATSKMAAYVREVAQRSRQKQASSQLASQIMHNLRRRVG